MNGARRSGRDRDSLSHRFNAYTFLLCEVDKDLIGRVGSRGGVEVELVAASMQEHD